MHDMPMAYHADAPAAVNTIAKAQWAERVDSDGELCIIDDEYYFVHGVLQLPVHGGDEVFEWGVWVSLSPAAFNRTVEQWETPGRESEPAYFGWLSTELPYSPTTINLKTHVQTRAVGQRPLVLLHPSDHPLAIEQHRGITMARVQEIVEQLEHSHDEH